MVERIDGALFSRMIVSAAAAIEAERQAVNELNVFPVPDGDTGTNMSLTISAAAAELKKSAPEALGQAAGSAAQALLRGARGNSGVILSLLFRGFARVAKELPVMDGLQWAEAMREGVQTAYGAVMKPAEGTILTVSRVSSEEAYEFAQSNRSPDAVLETMLQSAQRALAETVHQNPVLQAAGVIDAGGRGWVIILSGMLAALRGQDVVSSGGEVIDAPREKAQFGSFSTEDIKFAYCTEFIVTRAKKGRDPRRLQAFLETAGDSLVMLDDAELIKVHIHTNHPGKVLEEALFCGALTSVKIENMKEQHSEQVVRQEETHRKVPPSKKYGFVAVCAGTGVEAVFRDLGADELVSGGQTMNPSTEDILRAVDKTPAEVVFVLPNNKNIILAAEQCVPLTDKMVVVIPTKSIPQGISAQLAFDPQAELSDNREAMEAAMSRVNTGHITYAARDSQYDGRDIAAGDHMSLLDGALLFHDPDRGLAVRALASQMAQKNPSFITVFYGEGVSSEEAAATGAVFEQECPGAEVGLINGGQPVYYYLVSAE